MTWHASNSLALALVCGTLVAIPAVYRSVTTRYKSYAEMIYQVGNSPHQEARLLEWAKAQPGIEKVLGERRDGDLWLRWEYRGAQQPAALLNVPNHLRQLGYDIRGMQGVASGAISRNLAQEVADVLTDAQTLALVLFGTQASFGIFGLLCIRAAARREQPLPALFARHDGRSIATGALVGLTLFAFGLLYTMILKLCLRSSPPSIWDATGSMPMSTRIVFLVFGAIGAPLAEETFFRGYIFGTFKREDHVRAGVFISAILFAAAHFSDAYNVPAVFLYGVTLAWLYQATGSLLSSVVAHAINNALAISVTFWP